MPHVAYQQLSEPRRRLIHLHLAQPLNALTTSDCALINNDVVHHVSLGGNHSLAASASLLAAEQCLRVFAYAEGKHRNLHNGAFSWRSQRITPS